MTNERTLTRRQHLKGIAATGALVGASGLSVGAVAGGKPDWIDHLYFEDCHSLWVVLDESIERKNGYEKKGDGYLKDLLPKTMWLTVTDPVCDRVELIRVVLTVDDFRYDEKRDSKLVAEFNLFQYRNRPMDEGGAILAAALGGKKWTNPNKCAKKAKKFVDGRTDSKAGEPNSSDLSLDPISTNAERDRARFRVENHSEKSIEVSVGANTMAEPSTIPVWPESATYLDVPAENDLASVRLYYDGREVDSSLSETGVASIPREDLSLECVCDEGDRHQFRALNWTGDALTLVWRVRGTKRDGVVTLDLREDFPIDLPKGADTVDVYYEGERIISASATDCDD